MKVSEKNIKTEAPILFSLKKETNLKVPKRYFERLPNELMKITEKKLEKSNVISLKKRLIYSATIAALFIIGFLSFQQKNQTSNEVLTFNKSFNELTAESFENDFNDELELFIDFGDNKEDFLLTEMDKPFVKKELTNNDFYDFFETDIDFYF